VRLSIIVPSWNGPAILASHLPSVVAEAERLEGGCEVLVVDDGSDTGKNELEEAVRSSGPLVRLIRQREHLGFSATCNRGAAKARGHFLLFLNSDMHVEEGCLTALLAALDAEPSVLAASPVILNLEEGFPESTSRMRFRRGVFDPVFPGREGEAAPVRGRVRRTAFVCGGALACRRRRFLDTGGFATVYSPAYWEDTDFGWRALREGYTLLEVGDARALHDHASTTSIQLGDRRIRHMYERNRLLFTWIHLSGARSWLAHLAWLPVRLTASMVRRDVVGRALLSALARAGPVWRQRRRLSTTARAAGDLLRRLASAGKAGWPRTEDEPGASIGGRLRDAT